MNRHPRARSAVRIAQLVGWKLRQRSRQMVDALGGGFGRLEARGRAWAEQWRRDYTIEAWLARPGAGAFWIPVATATEWARATWTPEDQRIAADAARGIVDLLGSGPIAIGEIPAWRVDLYSGREWPLEEAFRLGFHRGDGSDIRTVWELSRGAYFLPLARAFWSSGEERFRDTFTRHVTSWPAQNPLGQGPNWATPMEVALRAANWVIAVLLFAPAAGIAPEFWEGMLANLYTTGLFLERYPEWHPVYRGNHYIADGVGLAYLGALFRDTAAGQRWLRAGARILASEMQRQVHADGTSFEASLGYHRFVTELFTYGGAVVRANLPDALPTTYDERLRRMYAFIDAYLPPSDVAPMLGDADDSRLHAVSAEGWGAPRRHRLGLPVWRAAAAPPASAAYPQGGFYVLRSGSDHLIVRCGPVGLAGAGSHDHNDHLSFELEIGGRRVVADSGTYAYTRDLTQRFAFRGTAAHSVVQLGDEEQNPILRERPWRVLADRTRSECLRWQSGVGTTQQLFEGQHFGYAHRASRAICRRRIVAWPELGWQISDEILGSGVETLTWRLHLAPTKVRSIATSPTRHELVLPGHPAIRLVISAPPGLSLTVGESAASDRYGARYARPCLILTGAVALPARVETTFTVERA
jgi:hypothetical protein